MISNSTTTSSRQIAGTLVVDSGQCIDFAGQELTCAPGFTGPAIQPVGSGWTIKNVRLRGFTVGIDTSRSVMAADGCGEPLIEGCRIYDCGIGINLDSISDGVVSNCWIGQTKGHEGNWIDLPHQISETTGLAGVRVGPKAGAWTLSKIHVWGNICHGLLIWPSQTKVIDCRIEGGRVALITLAGWNCAIMGTEVWNVLENVATDGTKSPAIAPALKLGQLNQIGELGFDPAQAVGDYSAKQNSVELLVSSFSPMFPAGVIFCDHEDSNVLAISGIDQDNCGATRVAGRIPPGGNSKLLQNWCVSSKVVTAP